MTIHWALLTLIAVVTAGVSFAAGFYNGWNDGAATGASAMKSAERIDRAGRNEDAANA